MVDISFVLKVAFYQSEVGNEPVREWLKELPRDDKRLIGEDIKTVQLGWPLGMPLLSNLTLSGLNNVGVLPSTPLREHMRAERSRSAFFRLSLKLLFDKTPPKAGSGANQKNRKGLMGSQDQIDRWHCASFLYC
jgi:hypothetical protein